MKFSMCSAEGLLLLSLSLIILYTLNVYQSIDLLYKFNVYVLLKIYTLNVYLMDKKIERVIFHVLSFP